MNSSGRLSPESGTKPKISGEIQMASPTSFQAVSQAMGLWIPKPKLFFYGGYKAVCLRQKNVLRARYNKNSHYNPYFLLKRNL
jgi:hypothetical protein